MYDNQQVFFSLKFFPNKKNESEKEKYLSQYPFSFFEKIKKIQDSFLGNVFLPYLDFFKAIFKLFF